MSASSPSRVLIRRNSDGLLRLIRRDEEWSDDDLGSSNFVWREGNWSCDCNRHLIFERAAGIEPEEDFPCGDQVGYTVLFALHSDLTLSILEGDEAECRRIFNGFPLAYPPSSCTP
jgi:hypothetical protein